MSVQCSLRCQLMLPWRERSRESPPRIVQTYFECQTCRREWATASLKALEWRETGREAPTLSFAQRYSGTVCQLLPTAPLRGQLGDPGRREDNVSQMWKTPKLAEEEMEPRLLVQPPSLATVDRLHRRWPIREVAVDRQA